MAKQKNSIRASSIIYIILVLFTLMLFSSCEKKLGEEKNNYYGNWIGCCDGFKCAIFLFNDSINTLTGIDIVRSDCNRMLVAKSKLYVEEYSYGVLKITQDSCYIYDYDPSEPVLCEWLTRTKRLATIEDNIILDYNFYMRYKEFYLNYRRVGDTLKVKYYFNPEKIPNKFESDEYFLIYDRTYE